MTDDQTLLDLAGRATAQDWAAFSDDTGNGHTNLVAFDGRTRCILSLPGRDKREPDIRWIEAATPERITRLISEKRSEAARADLTGFMLAWVVAVAGRDERGVSVFPHADEQWASPDGAWHLRIPVEMDEGEQHSCPACGALPCDWVDNPYAQPSRIIEPVTPETVFRAGDRVRARITSMYGNIRAGEWYGVREVNKRGDPILAVDVAGDPCWWPREVFDLIERAPQ